MTPVKYSEHIVTITKPVDGTPRKPIRITLTDPQATDSSDDEPVQVRRRIKKHVYEITFQATTVEQPEVKLEPPNTKRKAPTLPAEEELVEKPDPVVKETSSRQKFKGVRMRQWGRFSAEIRDKKKRKRVWLGTFDTAEQAAAMYDEAAKTIFGAEAELNFPIQKQEFKPAKTIFGAQAEVVTGDKGRFDNGAGDTGRFDNGEASQSESSIKSGDSVPVTLTSPKSILPHGDEEETSILPLPQCQEDENMFKDFSYDDCKDVFDFGLEKYMSDPFLFSGTNCWNGNHEMEFGELDIDDFFSI